MEQYIPKSDVVAEIERRLDELYDLLPDASKVENGVITTSEACNTGKYTALESFRRFLDTLEVKEVDLEKELKHYCNDYYNCDYPKQLEEETCSEVMPHIVSAAKHFFELGLFSQLTWKDIRLISEIGEDFMNSEESDNLGEEEYYTMILNKLKEKGRDYKTERQITRELEQKGEEV